jgi:cation diffusion facilitator CzcD-associated flavoprotein CzcO
MNVEHFDVLIVGAGISGIAAGYHLQANCPGRSYAILERRDQIGGTWELFRYPGIRSDSDMYTLGFSFRPWTDPQAIADGPSILQYLNETATDHNIDRNIRFGYHVKRASWATAEARWTVETDQTDTAEPCRFTCNFLFMCSGYYNYDAGYTPEFAGAEEFQGQIVHPQKWTEDIDYADKRVVVIGSGATAVTLVPAMAKTAAHVTMLQRSPSYIVAMPSKDPAANLLRRVLPSKFAYAVTRWKNVLLGAFIFWFCRRFPERAKALILGLVRKELGPDYDVEQHFTPKYNPWQQRLCLAPNSDFFKAIKTGQASVVTGHIETFTERGIRLRSGSELEADLIVTATGLNLQLLGGLEVLVDGKQIEFSKTLTYKGVMFNDVPNMAMSIGYTNASWTLKCDLTCEYICRLLNHMAAKGYDQCCPRQGDPDVELEPMLDFTSGYIQRSIDAFPKQGPKAPWKSYQNYMRDVWTVTYGSIEDGAMAFTTRPAAPRQASTTNDRALPEQAVG